MIVGIADTHAILWYIFGDQRLSVTAKTFIDTSSELGDYIGVSSITLVEIVYLIEKRKVTPESLSVVITALEHIDSVFIEIPLDYRVARALSRVSAIQIPDMPDRIVAATAIHLNVPVISRDGKIRVSGVSTIW